MILIAIQKRLQESTKSQRLKERKSEEYNKKDREVKKSAREDKRKWIEERIEVA